MGIKVMDGLVLTIDRKERRVGISTSTSTSTQALYPNTLEI